MMVTLQSTKESGADHPRLYLERSGGNLGRGWAVQATLMAHGDCRTCDLSPSQVPGSFWMATLGFETRHIYAFAPSCPPGVQVFLDLLEDLEVFPAGALDPFRPRVAV